MPGRMGWSSLSLARLEILGFETVITVLARVINEDWNGVEISLQKGNPSVCNRDTPSAGVHEGTYLWGHL